jgi:hypothetical protein
MIIKAMAITRCPYCHAITDENDKYCNNCGTQLLFPEDDEVDEEIPGEKIIDAEVEEKDYTVVEPKDEKRPAPVKDVDTDIDEELEEEMKEEAAETALDELVAEEALEGDGADVTEEVILVDEIEASEAANASTTGELGEKADPGLTNEPVEKDEDEDEDEDETKDEDEKDDEEEIDEEDRGKEKDTGALVGIGEAKDEEPVIEYLSGEKVEGEQEAATAGESALRPITFDTQELEGIGRTVELSKDKIDELVEVLVEKKPEETPAPPPTGIREPTGSLPPWASTMKGAPVFPPDTGPVESRKELGSAPPTSSTEEVEIFPRRKAPDSTMGLPERVKQAPLPFERGAAEVEETAEEEAGEAEEETREVILPPAEAARPSRPSVLPVREPVQREAEAARDIEEPRPRPPFSFSVFFKSKTFDALFVGIFWLVALWLAAHAMGQTLFEILGSVSGPMLLLYAVFILLYFFLFKFFLGETLGDRLFRPRD